METLELYFLKSYDLFKKSVIWLDGHWSGRQTAGEHDECPLLDELSWIANREDDLILIDDARLFLHAPPPPNNPNYWPGIMDIMNIFIKSSKRRFIKLLMM